MELTVLMDNHTEIDVYYLGEPAVSYWIRADGKQFLFDAGYSDAFLHNAQDMNIDVTAADAVILSHGHNDHTGGLRALLSHMTDRTLRLIAHPHALFPKHLGGMDIGMPLPLDVLSHHMKLTLTKQPLWLTERLLFLGEIPRTVAFEPPVAIGETYLADGLTEPDFLMDDTALAYVGNDGLYLITGCSHAGICNIIRYAKQITGVSHIAGLIGGLHLFSLDERSQKTIALLAEERIPALYPCHCTSFAVRAALHTLSPVQEVGVGMTLKWE